MVDDGCEQLNDYLITHPQKLEEINICLTHSRQKIAANAWVKEGENLAKEGDLQGALDKFKKALDWNPNLHILARRLSASATLTQGMRLVRQGQVKEAIAAYTNAQKIDPNFVISADDWNKLCRYGSLYRFAAEVMFACKKAVELAPENGDILDHRGLARALIGDTNGAIEDFQAFVDWTDNEDAKIQRQAWIKVLRAGENPFTDELLESLR